jgi:two-component system, chemotaxis family, sensor kinase CheA
VDLSRFQALYAAESKEQLERLTGALLELEHAEDPGAGVTEAYRAMHTLKGVAATMGHDEVARHAHELEDALELLRGEAAVDAATVDALLRRSDVLRAAVEASLSPAPEVGGGGSVSPRRIRREVRVEQERLDQLCDAAAELTLLQARLSALSADAGDAVVRLVSVLGRHVADLHVEMLALRLVPLGEAFDRIPRQVRDLARQLGKRIDLRVEGRELRIDRAVLEGLHEPLLHLVRNAVDHGLEPAAEREAAGKPAVGSLRLRAERDRGSVRIEVCDDGRGVDTGRVAARAAELGFDAAAPDALLRVLSEPCFTTARELTDLSGRGVGLDAVATKVRALGGTLSVESTAGAGTTFVVRVPITRSLTQALLVRVAAEDYVIPLTHVAEAIDLEDGDLAVTARDSVEVRGESLRLVRLGAVLGATAGPGERAAVVAEVGERRAALAVDAVIGREQFLVKGFDAPVGMLPLFSGATLLADGRPAFVLDPGSLI